MRAVLGLALGAAVGVVVLAVGAAVADRLEGAAAEEAHAAARSLAAVAGLAAALGHELLRRGRRDAALALGVGSSLLVAGWVALVGGHGRARPAATLLESDRDGLEAAEIDGLRWVRHRTLGFRLPQPDIALEPSPAIVDQTMAHGTAEWADRHQLWAFETADRSITVVLDLSRAEAVSRDALERLRAASALPLEAAGHRVDRGPLRMDHGCGSARFGAALPRGGRLEGRVLAFQDVRSHRAFHLVATIAGPASAAAGEYLDRIVVPCGG